jgi:hypothetical protein
LVLIRRLLLSEVKSADIFHGFIKGSEIGGHIPWIHQTFSSVIQMVFASHRQNYLARASSVMHAINVGSIDLLRVWTIA